MNNFLLIIIIFNFSTVSAQIESDSIIVNDGIRLKIKIEDSLNVQLETGFVAPEKEFITLSDNQIVIGEVLDVCLSSNNHYIGKVLGVLQIRTTELDTINIVFNDSLNFKLKDVVVGESIKIEIRPYDFSDFSIQNSTGLLCLSLRRNNFIVLINNVPNN